MSTNSPDRTGGQQLKGRTAVTQLRAADANAQAAYTSTKLSVVGQVAPGALSFQESASAAEVKHGTTAVTVERHMSERSAGFQATINDSTRLLKQLQNMSGIVPTFTQATQGWTQSTIGLGSTTSALTLTSTSGLTTNDKVYAKWDAGTLYEREEERLVANVVDSTHVTLQRPFSTTPEATTLLKRAIDTVFYMAGADYKEYTANLKMTGDDSSTHILHYPNAVVSQASRQAATNAQVMGSQINFTANASEYTTDSGEIVPKFSEEHDIPRNVALAINA